MRKLLSGIAFLALSCVAQADGLENKLEELGKMDHVKVESARIVKRNDLINIQVELSNDSTRPQVVFYRFKWLDASGFMVGGEETWKQVLIYGKAHQTIQTVAPVPQAVDFRLQLQSPENTVTPNN